LEAFVGQTPTTLERCGRAWAKEKASCHKQDRRRGDGLKACQRSSLKIGAH
jgi:hypothetical protein